MAIAREGSRFAEEALSQSIQRQQLGTVRPLEILQAQEIYIRSKLDELKAAGEFNKQQYKLFVAVGNNL
jgi:outer membrane protein TolC